jgi:putative heme degradation protein
LECYAGDGSTIVQLFAKRSDDEPVPERWNVLLDRLRANHA